MSENEEKQQNRILNWIKGANITLIVLFLSGGAYVIRKDQLTFDSQEQKNEIIREVPAKIESHINDKNSHMSFEEKSRLIILEQKQNFILEGQIKTNKALEKVGTDLQEIKNLTRRNNNSN